MVFGCGFPGLASLRSRPGGTQRDPGKDSKSQGERGLSSLVPLGQRPDRQLELAGRPGKSQKEGQEDQRTLGILGRGPPNLFLLPGPPGLPCCSSQGSLELPLRISVQGDTGETDL